MVSMLGKLLGDANEKAVKKLLPMVEKVNEFEDDFQKLTDDQLRNKTSEFKGRLADGESLDDLLPEAFAVGREAAKRHLGQRHYDVQLIGGVVLHRGEIAEMKTGEGKTLVATLAVYLNALSGQGVHRGHRQRLSGPPRPGVDGANLPRAWTHHGLLAARRSLPL